MSDIFKENAKFMDLRVGDLIRQTSTYTGNVTCSYYEYVDRIDSEYAWSKNHELLSTIYDDDDDRFRIDIMQRAGEPLVSVVGLDTEPRGRVSSWVHRLLSRRRDG